MMGVFREDLDGLVSWERMGLEMRGGKEEKMAV